MKESLALVLLWAFWGIATSCTTERMPEEAKKPAATDADNTERRERDRSGGSLISGDQAQGETDREITQQIRQSVLRDDSLSVNAQKVKITTSNGVVTLRGVVHSDKERRAIEAKAKQVAGVKSVDNQIEIGTDK